jgi:hypothetical protein
MLAILQRLVLPVLLIVAGAAAVIYGVKYHSTQVFEETEVEKSVMVPAPFPAFPPPGQFSPLGEGAPFPDGPPMVSKRVTFRAQYSKAQFEPALVREVTFGGVTLRESGDLWRTYTGTPPSLCPT